MRRYGKACPNKVEIWQDGEKSARTLRRDVPYSKYLDGITKPYMPRYILHVVVVAEFSFKSPASGVFPFKLA